MIGCPACGSLVLMDSTAIADSQSAVCKNCGTAIASLENPLPAEIPSGTVIGRFELISPIGQGSFGVVWKAYDPHLDRHVAIKIPRREELGPVEAELFLREARTAAQVQHPNVVGIHEVDRDGDQIYLVCDLIEGDSLSTRCAGRDMTVFEAASVIRTMAMALSHVHQCGVIHRDLKPSNILIDRNGKAYLADFGLARRMHGDVTLTVEGQLVGTPAYMSPEQAKGDAKQVDERSDIYSLGVVLYELITHQRPFDGAPHAVLDQVVNDPPVRPRKLNSHIPRDLETICLKCMEKKPGKRFLSAAEMAVDLDRFAQGKPIHSRRVGMFEKAWRWSRRHPWMTALAVSILCFSISASWVSRANRLTITAQQKQKDAQSMRAITEKAAVTIILNYLAWLANLTLNFFNSLAVLGEAFNQPPSVEVPSNSP